MQQLTIWADKVPSKSSLTKQEMSGRTNHRAWVKGMIQNQTLNVLVLSSVTKMGDFWKFLAIKFHTKVANIFCDILGNSEIFTFQVQLLWRLVVEATFGNFWKYFG